MKLRLLSGVILIMMLLTACSKQVTAETDHEQTGEPSDVKLLEKDAAESGVTAIEDITDHRHSINYELGDLADDFTDTPTKAVSGDIVELRTVVLMDADIHVFLDDRELEKTHSGGDYWEYSFTMPDKDVVITARPYTKSEIRGISVERASEWDDIINKYKSSQSDMWESYSEIAKKYYDTQALLISNGADSLDNIDESLNKLYFGLQGTLSAEAAQTLLVYDVNNDGIPEFFIARKYPGESKNTIYAGYTWKDGKLYQLMKGQEIGYRSGTIDLREDGKVLSFSSGSAWTFGVDVYILPEKALNSKKLKGLAQ